MGIVTKFNPLGALPKNNNYKAYLLFGTNLINVRTLGFTEDIQPEFCFSSSDDSIQCNYAILNGKLFFVNGQNLSQVGTYTDWTAISGYSDGNDVYALGIRNGLLYKIMSTTATMHSPYPGWTKICGNASPRTYGLGICNSVAYAISSNAIVQPIDGSNNPLSNCTNITGRIMYNSSRYGGYGISNGKLYYFQKRSSDNADTDIRIYIIDNNFYYKICGFAYGSSFMSAYALGIDTNFSLFNIGLGSASQIGTNTNWTNISGYNFTYSSPAALGINNGNLYIIQNSNVTQVGTDTDWTNISGNSLAIKNNEDLYLISSNNSFSLLIKKCIKFMGNTLNSSFPALIITG